MVVVNEFALSRGHNLAQGYVRTIVGELLLEDDYAILFLQADHVRSKATLGYRKVHTQRRRLAYENTVQTAAVPVHLDFLDVGVLVDDPRKPEVVLVCTTPIHEVEMGCEELTLLLECHIPYIIRACMPPPGIW